MEPASVHFAGHACRFRPLASAQASSRASCVIRPGAVLPGDRAGVGPAMIEKVREVVTDGNGQFRIVDLRPGAYTVTFTLPGFLDHQARGDFAGGFLHRHGQRRHAGRRAGRDGDRHR